MYTKFRFVFWRILSDAKHFQKFSRFFEIFFQKSIDIFFFRHYNPNCQVETPTERQNRWLRWLDHRASVKASVHDREAGFGVSALHTLFAIIESNDNSIHSYLKCKKPGSTHTIPVFCISFYLPAAHSSPITFRMVRARFSRLRRRAVSNASGAWLMETRR